MRLSTLLFVLVCFPMYMFAQMFVGNETLYGNEWIDYDKNYFKIKLADDGIFRISQEALESAGFPISETTGSNLQLFSLGNEVPLFVSTSDAMNSGDYLEFVGKKNRGELDQHLYVDPETEQLNPEYSLFTDTSVYFLTYDNSLEGLRYEENGSSFVTAQDYYVHEEMVLYNSFHHKPTYNNDDHIQYSHFDRSEGFGNRLEQVTEIELEVDDLVETSSYTPKAYVRFGSNFRAHSVEVKFNNNLERDETYTSFGLREYEIELQNSTLQNTNIISVAGTASASDRYTVAYGKLHYPRTPNFEGDYFEFLVEEDAADKHFEFSYEGGDYFVIDLENSQRTKAEVVNDKIQFSVAAGSKRKIILHKENTVNDISNMTPKTFVDFRGHNASYFILTGEKIYDKNDPNDAVLAYAEYRASEAGGSYETYIATAEEAIDQFAYGIPRHCIGNRNLAHYLKNEWPNLRFWFNIGKGLEYSSIRFSNSNNSEIFNAGFIVPTYGAPGSDIMMHSERANVNPMYNSGRIAAQTQEDIISYLNKVKEHDNKDAWEQTYEGKHWMKNILHLSGGSADLQLFIYNSLEDMREEIEQEEFGSCVTTLRKFSSSVVDFSLAETATELINSGVSVITFFGHSATGTFDFSLEDPSKYENEGKYPLILSLGCFSGNIHTTTSGLSEDFVLEPNKAAIGFLASSGTAYVTPQAAGGKRLYNLISGEHYRNTFGEAITTYIHDNVGNEGIGIKTLMQQLTLHGDPAINLNSHESIDLTIDKNSVKTLPEIIDPGLDNFIVKFNLANIGSVVNDSVDIELIHYGPDGVEFQRRMNRVEIPRCDAEFSFVMDVPNIELLGKNSIEIIVDGQNAIEEMPNPSAELNNSLKQLTDDEGFCFFILDNGVRPVAPQEFAILNDNCPFQISGSTNNAFLPMQNYMFEIDTTEFFNSPLLEKAQIASNGGLINYDPAIEKIPEQVYYWRVAADSTDNNLGLIWMNSSFVYAPDEKEGWNQSHYFQFLKNDLNTLQLNEERNWELLRENWDYRFDLGKNVESELWAYVNSVPWDVLNPSNLGSFVGVHAQHPTLRAYLKSNEGNFGSLSSANNMFSYKLDDVESRENFANLINSIPEDYLVLVYSIVTNDGHDFKTEEWESDTATLGYNLFDVFEENGSTEMRKMADGSTPPFLFVFRKGEGVVQDFVSNGIDEEIHTSFSEKVRAVQEGNFFTKKIGLASVWDKVIWESSEYELGDEMSYNLYACYENDSLELIMSNITEKDYSINDLNEQGITQIQIEVVGSDFDNRTPEQMDLFRVLYTPRPDIAINTTSGDYSFNADTLEQGDPFHIRLPLKNLSTSNMEPALVNISLLSASGGEIRDTVAIGAIEGKSSQYLEWTYPSEELLGEYLLSIIYNVDKNPLEQSYGNNFAVRSFFVKDDNINPTLEMTFDGVEIMDGDIISCSPSIEILLKDNNEFLLVDDPSLFTLTLKSPDNTEQELDVLSNSEIQFFPAELGDQNSARIIYEPLLPQEGEYTLTVNAEDKNGNSSGVHGLAKRFRVIKTKSISNVYNYPNPFSTSTQFVFTITGDVPPENMHLNIYTLTGKLIKQILPEELGPLRIGLNRTEFKWNGTDEFGSKLANGTYLYKVKYDDPNGDYELFETEADLSFAEGFGKLVIMR